MDCCFLDWISPWWEISVIKINQNQSTSIKIRDLLHSCSLKGKELESRLQHFTHSYDLRWTCSSNAIQTAQTSSEANPTQKSRWISMSPAFLCLSAHLHLMSFVHSIISVSGQKSWLWVCQAKMLSRLYGDVHIHILGRCSWLTHIYPYIYIDLCSAPNIGYQ